ncbi:MAG: hypothetical protein P4L16_05215 [Chlamydiales bacterium]|nr:hypothetical protein [Chlamydiales bacterium]
MKKQNLAKLAILGILGIGSAISAEQTSNYSTQDPLKTESQEKPFTQQSTQTSSSAWDNDDTSNLASCQMHEKCTGTHGCDVSTDRAETSNKMESKRKLR